MNSNEGGSMKILEVFRINIIIKVHAVWNTYVVGLKLNSWHRTTLFIKYKIVVLYPRDNIV